MANKNDYWWYKEHGICTRCHEEPVKYGHSMCWRCLANRRDYDKIRYHEQGRSDKWKNQVRESAKARKASRESAGLCVQCGKSAPMDGIKTCETCTERNRQRLRQRRAMHGSIPAACRGDGLFCHRCCKPKCNGEKMCAECREDAAKSAAYARQFVTGGWKKQRIEFGRRKTNGKTNSETP